MIVLSTHYWNEGIVYVQHYVEIKSAIYLVWVKKPFLFFYPLAVGSFCAHQSDWDWTTIWQSITRLLSWHQPFLPWIGTIQEDSSTWMVFRHLIYVCIEYPESAKWFNLARCIANSICQVPHKLELHCTSQILNEYQD